MRWIVACLCGALYGGLVVSAVWTHRENERKHREFLDTLPPSEESDWAEFVELAAQGDPLYLDDDEPLYHHLG